MSAKVNCLVSIRMKSSEHSKTLQLCSEESVYGWKRLHAKRLDNVSRLLPAGVGSDAKAQVATQVNAQVAS